jgi:hypothetical protein
MTGPEHYDRAAERLAATLEKMRWRPPLTAADALAAALADAVLALAAGPVPDPDEDRAGVVAGLDADARDHLSRADGKAATLLALATGALAGLLALAQAARVSGAAAVLLWVAAGLSGVAVAMLLLAVRPWLAGGCGRGGLATHAAVLDAADRAGRLAAAEDQVRLLSGLAVSKYRRLRLSVDVLLCALAVLGAAAVAIAAGAR